MVSRLTDRLRGRRPSKAQSAAILALAGGLLASGWAASPALHPWPAQAKVIWAPVPAKPACGGHDRLTAAGLRGQMWRVC